MRDKSEKADEPHGAIGGKIPQVSEAVDLGLPSGTLWAPWNVGAAAADEAGGHFAWGETATGKACYDWKTYKFGMKLSRYDGIDRRQTLEPEDDAATANWGPQWKTPTAVQLEELRNECDWEWTSAPVPGYWVTSSSNGARIFLPAAGNRWKGELRFAGLDGYYWSADLRMDAVADGRYLYFCDGARHLDSLNRCFGRSVRAVLATRE